MDIKKKSDPKDDELRPEYDLASMEEGVRGKYFESAKAGSNVVLLDPDLVEAFPTSESVNEALRLLVRVAETTSAGS